MKKRFFTIFVPLVVFMLLLPLIVQAAPIGTVTAVDGNVDLTRANRPAKPVVLGEPVNAGDILRVKSKAKAEVTLVDGNILRLAANTRMKMTNYQTGDDKKSYFELFRGKTQAVVNKMGKNSSFEVHTPTAVCGVRGSIFFSSFINGQSSFVFSRGTGYGFNKTAPTLIQTLPPKILMLIPGANKPPILKPVTDTEINVLVKETAPADKPKGGAPKSQGGGQSGQGSGGGQSGQGSGTTGGTTSGEGQGSGTTGGTTGGTTTGGTTGDGQTGGTTGGTTTTTSTVNIADTTTTQTAQQSNIVQTTTTTVTTTTVTVPTTTVTTTVITTPPPTVTDTTAPTITFTETPASTTTADSATLSYTTDKAADFQYSVDGAASQTGASSATSDTTTLSDLPEGTRTFEVKATNSSGNSSTKTYTWTTDYSAGPTITSLTTKVAKPVADGKADIDLQFTPYVSGNAHKYRVGEGSYQAIAGATYFTATGLSPASGINIGVYERCQETGNRGSDVTTSAFTLHRYDFTGSGWYSDGGLMADPVSGQIAGISNQSWGSWKIAYQGTGDPAASWTYNAGKANDASGTAASQIYYWLSRGSATSSPGEVGGTISGTSSELTYLTRSFLGTGSNGAISGSYNAGSWSYTDTGISNGAGLYTETPLTFWGSVKQGEANNFMYWSHVSNAMAPDGSLTGMIGGTAAPWTGTPSFTGLGSYTNPNSRTLYQGRFDQTSYDLSGGNFRGNFGGIIKPLNSTENIYPTEGFGYAVYIKDPASSGQYETGYLKFNGITGNIFPDINLWKQTGTITKNYKGTTAYAPQNIDTYIVYDDTVRQRQIAGSGDGWSLSGYTKHKSYYLQGQSWRILRGESGGDFSGTPASSWTAVYGGKDTSNDVNVNYEIGNVTGSTWTDEKIAGTFSGKNLGWQTMGTQSGQILGNVAGAGNWQALSGGVSDSENLKFASLIGKWSSSSRTGASLIYTRTDAPASTVTINPNTDTYPIRFNINWSGSTDFDAHTWIAPQGNGSNYYHIYYNNKGLTGYDKYRYPYAYLDNDALSTGAENINYYRFQPGKTYFAVYRYSGSTSTVNAQIFDGSDYNNNQGRALSAVYQKTVLDNNYYWSVFRIDASLDPLANITVYQYDTYSPNSPMDLNTRVENDGSIIGIMGGTQSPIHGETTADIPVRFMGSYTSASSFNRFWGQDLVAYNDSTGKYVTFDDGTFFGVLGGSFRPGEKRVQGTFHTFAINSSGYAGLLRGSFGTGDSYPGTIYPDISMWEADGKVSRYDMNVASGITPSTLTGQWYAVSGSSSDPFYKTAWQAENTYLAQTHISSWNSNTSMHEGGWGMFLDGTGSTYTEKARMLDREDYIDLYRLKQDTNNTFGIWGWRALGKYAAQADYANPKWIMDTELGIRSGSYDNKKFRSQLIAYGNAWSSGGSFTGQVIGQVADGDLGFTGVMAGDTVGAFNNSPEMTGSYEYNSFGAMSTGSWIKTQTYLQMIDDTTTGGGREKLAALGYPTTEVALADTSKNLTGLLASKPEAAYVITGNNLRVFNAPNHSILNIFAAASSSSNTSYTVPISTSSIYPVTNGNSDLPVYGSLRVDYTSDSYWIGQINAFGAFQKADSSVIQGSLNGAVSGAYTASQFSGSTTGLFVESPLLSQLTADGKTATLKYYNGSDFVNDGELRGLLGSQNPVSWTANSTYPTYTELQLAGVWWPALSTPVQRSHVFNVPMYPTNFTNSTYTTTSGSSFWGYMPGIHQFVSSGSSQDGLEVGLASVFIDGTKAGFLIGHLGGPTASDTTGYYGFDFTNQAFAIDTSKEQAVLVEIGTTSVAATDLKANISSHSKQYTYSGGVINTSQQAIAGMFFTNGATPPDSYIRMQQSGSPTTRTVTANSINDATNVNGRWGVWSTDLFGSYDSLTYQELVNGTMTTKTYENYLMETKTPEPTGQESMPLQRMGAIIYGEKWQNNRLAGNVLGHWANVETATAMTGITFGKLLGTYDPSSNTFQAVSAGGFLETNQYLNMTATSSGRETLSSINVPCVQVGMVTLSGSNSDLSAQMADTKFFAFATGAVPQIWATNAVTGTVYAQDPVNKSVTMTAQGVSSPLTANFTMKNWDTTNNKWMGTVASPSAGNIGSTSNLQNLSIRGAAAGAISGSNFSGTGSGVVKQVSGGAQ